MLLLRANVLAKGFSGVRPALLQLAGALLNAGVHPVIPEKGSVGASGDLAPWLTSRSSSWRRRSLLSRRAVARRRSPATRRPAAPATRRKRRSGAAERHPGHDRRRRSGRGARAARGAACDLAGAMSLEALMGTPGGFRRAHSRRGRMRARLPRRLTWCACSTDRKFASRIANTTRGYRTPTACAACPRSTARCAMCSRTSPACSKSRQAPPPIIP